MLYPLSYEGSWNAGCMLVGSQPFSVSNDRRATSHRRGSRGSREPRHRRRPETDPARPPGATLEHGDWSTNAALVVAKAAGRPPREVASDLAAALSAAGLEGVEGVEVAGPGFVNFRLATSWLHHVLEDVVAPARSPTPRRISEAVSGSRSSSCQPTRPARCTWQRLVRSYGDALGRVMTRCGWSVSREFYVNDTGGQIRQLGESLLARRRGEAVPEGGYQGEYVAELAEGYDGPDDVVEAGRFAVSGSSRTSGRRSAGSTSLRPVVLARPRSRRAEKVAETIELLRSGSSTSRTGRYGSGRPSSATAGTGCWSSPTETPLTSPATSPTTVDKFSCVEFDRVIESSVPTITARSPVSARRVALGVESHSVEIASVSWSASWAGGMSKRSGISSSLDEIVDRSGRTRSAPVARSPLDRPGDDPRSRPRHRRSMDNPVFYVQYAHARIASIERSSCRARHRARPDRRARARPARPGTASSALLRCLVDLPFVVGEAASDRARTR